MLKRLLPPKAMIVPVIVASGLFMQNLDSTIVTTALPVMAESFGDTPVHLSLAITSYLLSLAVFIPISGWVADRFGAREVFRAAILVFTLGSVLCGFSNNLAELTAARVVQGIGGAMMVPVGRLLLLRSIERTELVLAMSYLTTPAIIGPVIGPPLGGFITTYWSWRWIFLINVPAGLVGIAMVTWLIKNPPETDRRPLDWMGFVLTGAALTALTFGLDLLAHPAAGPGAIIGLIGAGVVLTWAAVRHARRHPHPLIDLSLLKIPTFDVSVKGGTLFRISAGALPFLLPVMLQAGFGMTAFKSGLITFTSAVGAFMLKITIGRILRRLGYRQSMMATALISAVSLMVCAFFTAETPVLLMCGLLFIGGYFRSFQYTSLNSLAFVDVPQPKMSAATSISSMMQQLSSGMGVALGAIIVNASQLWRGGATLDTQDVHIAFAAVAAACLGAVFCYARLAPDAGSDVSGHGRPAESFPGARSRDTNPARAGIEAGDSHDDRTLRPGTQAD